MLNRLLNTVKRVSPRVEETTDTDNRHPTVEHRGFDIPRKLAWRTGTLREFTRLSDKHVETLRRYADLDSARSVVEIGCGVGRDAITLIEVLPENGSYLGIDVMPESIAWAHDNITSRDPRFEFRHFDVKDPQHNPSGQHEMSTYRVERSDGSIDLVFLFSVFTHMFPQDVAYYLREFDRILKPGGRVLASMFIMQDGFRDHLLRIGGGGARNLTFQHEVEPGFFHNDPNVRPGATAYSRDRIAKMAESAGLEVETFAMGSWSKKPDSVVQGQDIVVLTKSPHNS